jgi:hypothetical protein
VLVYIIQRRSIEIGEDIEEGMNIIRRRMCEESHTKSQGDSDVVCAQKKGMKEDVKIPVQIWAEVRRRIILLPSLTLLIFKLMP